MILKRIQHKAESVGKNQLFDGFAVPEIHEVCHAISADNANSRTYRQRNIAGRDRSFFLCLIVGKVHGGKEVLLHLIVRPICGIVLRVLKACAEVEHSLYIGVIQMLLDNRPPQVDVVNAQEHIPGKPLPLPSVSLRSVPPSSEIT